MIGKIIAVALAVASVSAVAPAMASARINECHTTVGSMCRIALPSISASKSRR